MSDASFDDLSDIRRGGRRRALLVFVLVLVGVGFGARLLRSGGSGAPELPHRLLIVGGVEGDLSAAVRPAGFDANQIAWDAAEAELGSGFDHDALLDYADHEGYGFLAVVFDERAPWTPSEVDGQAPAEATVAVASVGRMRNEGQTLLRFGAVREDVEYPAGTRRPEALRLALYEHADLARLWDDPTPEQRTWRTPIAKLPRERERLSERVQQQQRALDSWPSELPEGALTHPWVGVQALVAAEGMLVLRRTQQLRLRKNLALEQHAAPAELAWLPRADWTHPEALAQSPALELSTPLERARFAVSPDRRSVAVLAEDGQLLGWSLTPEGAQATSPADLPRRAGIEHELSFSEFAVSNGGAPAGRTLSTVTLPYGVFNFVDDLMLNELGYVGELGVVATSGERRPGCRECESLVFFAAPSASQADAGEPSSLPGLLTLDIDALFGADTPAESHAVLRGFAPSAAGLFVLIDRQRGSRYELVELKVPERALTQAQSLPDLDEVALAELLLDWERHRSLWLHNSTLDLATRPIPELQTLEGFELRVVGRLPPARHLIVAPAGDALAWSQPDEPSTLYLASLDDQGLGEARVITDLGDNWRDREPGFSADGSTLIVNASAETELRWAQYLRIVTR